MPSHAASDILCTATFSLKSPLPARISRVVRRTIVARPEGCRKEPIMAKTETTKNGFADVAKAFDMTSMTKAFDMTNMTKAFGDMKLPGIDVEAVGGKPAQEPRGVHAGEPARGRGCAVARPPPGRDRPPGGRRGFAGAARVDRGRRARGSHRQERRAEQAGLREGHRQRARAHRAGDQGEHRRVQRHRPPLQRGLRRAAPLHEEAVLVALIAARLARRVSAVASATAIARTAQERRRLPNAGFPKRPGGSHLRAAFLFARAQPVPHSPGYRDA